MCFGNQQQTQATNQNQNTTQQQQQNSVQNLAQNTAQATTQNAAQQTQGIQAQNTAANSVQQQQGNQVQSTAQSTAQNTAQNTAQTTGGPDWLTSAGQSNLAYAQDLLSRGFTPYSGQQVASFSPQQQQSFDLASQVAGGVAPYVDQTGRLISNYANAGPQSVSADSISSRMSPYMSQYVQQALAPQLALQDQQFAAQNRNLNAAATSSGAFGDARAGIEAANLSLNQDVARQGLVGSAYNSAFNTAIGAGAQDVANSLNAGATNANLAETALGRQLTGANALTGAGTNATNLTNTTGAQQTAQSQASLNAAYNQYLMAQQYPFLAQQNMDQAIGAGRTAAPITTTGQTTGTASGLTTGEGRTDTTSQGRTDALTQGTTNTAQQSNAISSGAATGSATGTQTGDTIGSMSGTGNVVGTTMAPNNAGFGLLGSLGIGAGMMFSDPRLKENAQQVGELYDGTPVHKFNFKGDPRTVIGLMAPEVKRRAPEAVANDNATGYAMVDYNKATRRAAGLAGQLGAAA